MNLEITILLMCMLSLHTAHLTVFLFSVKCGNKTVKNSYFTVCKICSDEQQICGKCGQRVDLANQYANFFIHIKCGS